MTRYIKHNHLTLNATMPGTTKGNNTSIGIEICEYTDKEKQRKAYHNAIELVKVLLEYYNWGVDKVRTHKSWSGKACPAYLLQGKWGFTWDWFKNQISEAKAPSNNEVDDGSFRVKILADELNVRSGPSTDYRIKCVVRRDEVFTIVQVQNNWGKLRSGAGWISIHSKYVKKL